MNRNRRLVDDKSEYAIAWSLRNMIWSFLEMIMMGWGIISIVMVSLFIFGYIIGVIFGNIPSSQYFKMIEHIAAHPKESLTYFTLRDIFYRVIY